MANHPNRGRKEQERQLYQRRVLEGLGISYLDAYALRRISLTLHRWHELECGVEGGGIERDEKTGKPHWIYAGGGFGVRRSVHPIPDRETGALRRLAKIMAAYPHLQAYVQGDPRGCALYVLRPGDVPEGKDASAYYSRGIAVY